MYFSRIRKTAVFSLLWGILLFSGSLLQGANPVYAPLINSRTTALIRVNREKLNIPSLVQSGMKAANKMADTMITDPETAKQIKVGLPLMMAGYMTGITALFDAMKDAEISELYFVSTPGVPESPGFFALPLTGYETDEQIENLQKGLVELRSFNLPLMRGFRRHGFLFAPVVRSQLKEDQLKEFVVREFKELDSEPRPIFEKGLREFPEAGISFIYAGNSETEKEFTEAMADLQDSVRETKNSEAIGLADVMNQGVVHLAANSAYAAVVLDQSDSSVKIRVRMKKGTKEAAADIAEFAKAMRKAAESGNTDQPLTEDQQELVRELTDLLLPQVSKDTLDWKFDSEFIEVHKPLIERYIRLIKKRQEEKSNLGGAEDRPNRNEEEK